MKRFIILAALLILAAPMFAQTVWTGAVSTNWQTTGNWNPAVVPNSSTDVVIPGGLSRYPVLAGVSGQCKDLTINTGATVTSDNQPVVVNRNMTVHGQIILLSTLSWMRILGNTVWKSGSSITSDVFASMEYYGSVTFESGSNVQMAFGFAKFLGTGNSYIYNHSANTRFWNFQNQKTSTGFTSIASASTQPMTIRNITNQNDATFYNYYAGNIFLNGDMMDNNTVAGKGINWYGGTLVTGGGHQYLNLNGTHSFLNHLKLNQSGTLRPTSDLNLRGNLEFVTGTLNTMSDAVVYDITLGGNWINPTGPGSFVENSGKVTFNGTSHQYCNNSEDFYTLEVANSAALRFGSGATITCQVYDWTSGGIDVNVANVTFTANDLADNGIAGSWWLTAASTINLYNPPPNDWIDLKGDLYITSGTFNVYGGSSASYWPYTTDGSVFMSGGVLDFKDRGLYIWSPGYSLSTNITAGTIRLAGSIYCSRSDFTPGGTSVMEFTGTTDANIQMSAGTLNNVRINKMARDESETRLAGTQLIQRDREGNETRLNRANTVSLYQNLSSTGWFNLQSGVFDLVGTQMNIAGYATVNGTIRMDNSAEKITVGSYIRWQNGSVADFTAGSIDVYGYWGVYAGSSVQIPTAVTTRMLGTTLQTFLLQALNTSFGNLQIGGASAGAGYTISPSSTQPLIVNGNLSITANNELDLGSRNLSVAGDLDLYGVLDIHASSAAVQGVLYSRAGSLLSIDTGSFEFFNNNVFSNRWIYGTISINSGTLTSSNADLRFSTGSLLTMTSGMINCAGINATATNVFQPAGGTVRFTPIAPLTGYGLHVTNGNWLPNCIVDTQTFVQVYEDLVVIGNLSINQGTLMIDSGISLKMAPGKIITVNSGSTLEAVGESGSNVVFTRNTTGFYYLNVESGGTLKASYATFEYLGGAGVNIKSGAIVDGTTNLYNCTFRNGSTGGTLLTIDNAQELIIINAVFPTNTWSGESNVAKNTNQGCVYFSGFSGGFAGESYDDDDHQRVFWEGQNLPPIKDLNIVNNTSPESIRLSWSHMLQDIPGYTWGVTYKIYRSLYPEGPWTSAGTTWNRIWTEELPGAYYFYKVSAIQPDYAR